MGKKICVILIFFLLGLSFVFATPVFVYTNSLDADTVYGPNDPTINIKTAWNQNNYIVSGNFTCVDSTPMFFKKGTVGGSDTGIIEYTTEQFHSPPTAIKMFQDDPNDYTAVAGLIKNGTLLSDLTGLNYWAYVTNRSQRVDPFMTLYLDENNDYVWDYYLQAEPVYTEGYNDTNDTWFYYDAYNKLRWSNYELPTSYSNDCPYSAPTLKEYINGSAMTAPCPCGSCTTPWASREYGSLKILRLELRTGYGSTWSYFKSYVDDIRVSGINVGNITYATNNGDGTYTLAYTIITPPADQNCTIPITALDLSDNSTLTNYDFNITIDSTPPTVSNLNYFPPVIFNVTDAMINATITDGNIKNVLVSGDWGSVWENYSISNAQNPFYEIDSSYISNMVTVNFGYYATDLANNIGYAFSLFTLTKRTILTVIPNQPDGLNNWYVTTPHFVLTPDTGRTAYYRWDWLSDNQYNLTPFNYSEIPGGIEDLSYWSTNTTGNSTWGYKEPEQIYFLKLDANAPLITNLKPANNSQVSDTTPLIYAYLDDVYQANSGVDQSSIVINLDGNLVTPTVNTADTLDAEVNYTPASPLLEGQHNVSIFAKDNAGNNRITAWHFNITPLESFNQTIFSPVNGSYNTRKIMFNISTNKEATIEYSIDGGLFRAVCRRCDSYGKNKYLGEGPHNLTIRATNGADNVLSQNFFIEIDSQFPKITRTLPKENSYLKGTNFSVKYNEINLKSTILQLNKINASTKINVSKDCDSGRNQECKIDVNLTSYNGVLEYIFFLKDNFNTIASEPIIINIDNLNPVITVNSPINIYNYPRGVLFNITLNEISSLEYTEGARTVKLCSRCEGYTKIKYFAAGNHNVTITATDFAGNIALQPVSFGVN